MVGVILEASTRVLARESLVGFNTNRVAAVAGVSAGLCSSAAQDCLTMTQALVEAHAGGSAQQLAQLKRRVLRALLGYLQHRAV
jgi:hypothetical protein